MKNRTVVIIVVVTVVVLVLVALVFEGYKGYVYQRELVRQQVWAAAGISSSASDLFEVVEGDIESPEVRWWFVPLQGAREFGAYVGAEVAQQNAETLLLKLANQHPEFSEAEVAKAVQAGGLPTATPTPTSTPTPVPTREIIFSGEAPEAVQELVKPTVDIETGEKTWRFPIEAPTRADRMAFLEDPNAWIIMAIAVVIFCLVGLALVIIAAERNRRRG